MGIFCLALRLFLALPSLFAPKSRLHFLLPSLEGLARSKVLLPRPKFPFLGQETIVRDPPSKTNNFGWEMSHFIASFIIFGPRKVADKAGGRRQIGEKWGTNFGQSQRNFMPWANKSAKPAGKWPKGRWAERKFRHQHLSKTRPNSRRALSQASSRDFPKQKTHKNSIIIIREWKQKCVTNQGCMWQATRQQELQRVNIYKLLCRFR